MKSDKQQVGLITATSLVVGNMKFLAVASGQENVFSQVEFAMGFMTVLTGKAKHVHYCFFWSQMSVTYS